MDKIKELRLNKGLTQLALAKKVGVSVGSIQFWEKNVSTPKKQNLEKLKQVLCYEWFLFKKR